MLPRTTRRSAPALLFAAALLVGLIGPIDPIGPIVSVGPVLAHTSADTPVSGAAVPTSTAGLQDVIRTIRKYLQMILTLVTVGEGYDSTGAPPHVGPGPLPSPQIEPEWTP